MAELRDDLSNLEITVERCPYSQLITKLCFGVRDPNAEPEVEAPAMLSADAAEEADILDQRLAAMEGEPEIGHLHSRVVESAPVAPLSNQEIREKFGLIPAEQHRFRQRQAAKADAERQAEREAGRKAAEKRAAEQAKAKAQPKPKPQPKPVAQAKPQRQPIPPQRRPSQQRPELSVTISGTPLDDILAEIDRKMGVG